MTQYTKAYVLQLKNRSDDETIRYIEELEDRLIRLYYAHSDFLETLGYERLAETSDRRDILYSDIPFMKAETR